jgi:hypothetical protein
LERDRGLILFTRDFGVHVNRNFMALAKRGEAGIVDAADAMQLNFF